MRAHSLVRLKRHVRQTFIRVEVAKVCAHISGVLAVTASDWMGRESLCIRREVVTRTMSPALNGPAVHHPTGAATGTRTSAAAPPLILVLPAPELDHHEREQAMHVRKSAPLTRDELADRAPVEEIRLVAREHVLDETPPVSLEPLRQRQRESLLPGQVQRSGQEPVREPPRQHLALTGGGSQTVRDTAEGQLDEAWVEKRRADLE